MMRLRAISPNSPSDTRYTSEFEMEHEQRRNYPFIRHENFSYDTASLVPLHDAPMRVWREAL